MTDVESSPGSGQVSVAGGRRRLRRVVGAVFMIVVAAAGGFALYRQRHEFVQTLHQFGPGVVLGSLACTLLGVAASFPVWREVLIGLGVRLPWAGGARLFFTSQLGKYVPGSVWPIVAQMEAGRAWGASRRAMVAANLMTNLLNACIGLLVGCLLLPAYDARALAHYGLALIALPFLVALLHPKVIPGILDRALALVHRPPLRAEMPLTAELRASAWSFFSWAALGLQLTVLCAALGHGGASTFLLCTGGMGLAYALGLLFLPAPAGAGVREVVLAFVLRSILPYGQALTVALASRLMLIGGDLILATASVMLGQALARHDRQTR
jgi:hypothetical protein